MADATATPGTIATTVAIPSVLATPEWRATPAKITRSFAVHTPTVTGKRSVVGGRFTSDIQIINGLAGQSFGYDRFPPGDPRLQYKLFVLEPGGQVALGALPVASIESMSWVLNGMGGMNFTMPIDAPGIELLDVAKCEVECWLGPDLMWSGVVVRARGDDRTVQFQCLDLAWYFTRRYVGTAERNYILNGDFEEGMNQWGYPHYDPSEPFDVRDEDNFTIAYTDWSISGSGSVFIHSPLEIWSNAGVGIAQGFTWEVDPATEPEGDTWYLVAWCYIPSELWIGPRMAVYKNDGTVGAMGAHFQRASSTQVTNIQGFDMPLPIEQVMVQIDESVPKDMWVRLEVPLEQPYTGEAEFVSVQLFAPIGAIYWDNISIVREEALRFYGVDEAIILKTLVEHAQDTAYGKSDLNIDTYCPLTGIRRVREYIFFNHELVSDCIDEWPGLYQGMDWDIMVTPTSRTFRSFYPQKGDIKMQHALILGKNIASIKMSRDGEETSNSVLVMADQGEGAAREEASSIDASALPGGLILEKVYPATPGSAVSTLKAQAERGVRRWKNPVEMPTVTCYQEASFQLLGAVKPGDIVPVQVTKGWYNLDGMYRIMEIELDPRTGLMSLSLNPYENWDVAT